ncbi:MAG: hypothetical protein ACE5SW_04995, partial [Nitrososphaeraceae archaeon]
LKLIGLSFFIVFSLNYFASNNISDNNINILSHVLAQTEKEKDSINNNNKESKSSSDNKDLTTITVQIDKNNIIESKNNNDEDNFLKIVGYLNGEGQTEYIDLNDINQEKEEINQNEKFLKVNLKFNKSTDISSTMVDDEYFVCAYLMEENNNNRVEELNKSNIAPYDCDEGNIGKSTTKDSVTLFSTMKKFADSKTFYIANHKDVTVSDKSDPDEVKVIIKVPVHDAKDIDDMNVVAMIKGEYQIKTIDVQEELKKGYDNDIIPVQFTFDRQTQVGPIQIGDLFFGCATSDEFPNQNSDCEKRMLKNLDKANKICARKDNKC